MLAVSDEYLETVGGPSRYFPVRLKFEGIDEYITGTSTFARVLTGSFTDIIDGNNILSMGNACANKMELTIGAISIAYVWKGARFTAEIGLKVNGVAEWVPLGTFWVADMNTPNHGKTVRLTAYDYMFKLSKKKYATALVAPFHYRDFLDEFLGRAGVTLSTTAELPDPTDEDYMILSWPDGEFSYSDIAGHLAGMIGRNAHISRSDSSVIEFKWYEATGTKIHRTLQQDGFEKLADSALRVDHLITGANSEIVIENTDDITDGELDFRPFDSADPADYPWLIFTYDAETLTASVKLNSEYASDTAPITIPYSLIYEGQTYDVTTIEESGFSGCQATEIVLPYTLMTIGGSAFSGSAIQSITIPESVTSIGKNAFKGTSALTTLYYNAINSAGPGAVASVSVFSGSGLQFVVIGEGVQKIPGALFNGCGSLKYINIPDGVTTIEGFAFYGCTGLTSITIPASVTSIGNRAFRDMTSLTTLYYNAINASGPGGIASTSVFGGSGLTTVVFGDGVQKIPGSLFNGCGKLAQITFPDSVTTIEGFVFAYCSSLVSVQIGETANCAISAIDYRAFYDCSNLVDITIYAETDSVSRSPWGASNATVTWLG